MKKKTERKNERHKKDKRNKGKGNTEQENTETTQTRKAKQCEQEAGNGKQITAKKHGERET